MGLVEGGFEVGDVVVLSVVVGDAAVRVLGRRFPDVGDAALDEREHVPRRLLAEHPPVASDGDVDGGGVGKHAARHSVYVVEAAHVFRTAASCGQPRVFVYGDLLPELEPPRAVFGLGLGDDLAVANDLQDVDGEYALGPSLDLDRAGP